MTTEEHLLTIAAEECAEVAQRCSKALRFGLEEIQEGQELTNAERIMQEFDDLYAVVILLRIRDIVPPSQTRRIEQKQRKILEYLDYSEKCGTLTIQ